MFIVDLTDPFTLVMLLIATILLIFLGKEIKKPHAPAIALILFLGLILMHSIQLSIIPIESVEELRPLLIKNLGLDFLLVFISFFGYLWVDDISCRFYKKKSIDNSLDWFWNKV